MLLFLFLSLLLINDTLSCAATRNTATATACPDLEDNTEVLIQEDNQNVDLNTTPMFDPTNNAVSCTPIIPPAPNTATSVVIITSETEEIDTELDNVILQCNAAGAWTVTQAAENSQPQVVTTITCRTTA